MSSSLPSANNDYAAPADMALSRAAWDAALVSVGARLRALEAIRADFEELIELGTSQALSVIAENVEPQLAVVTATLAHLEAAVAEAEDTIQQIITGSIPASAVSQTTERIWLTPTLRDAWNAKQAGNAKLTALSGLALAAGKLIYATGETTLATADLTELSRTLLASASADAMRTVLGAANADTAQTKTLAAVSVLGRASNSSGDMAAITAAANDRLLARVSNALAFVQLTLGMVPDGLLTPAKFAAGAIRERLTANRTYYVRTNGSDSNNGLADTAGGAFQTIQKAINTCYALDLNGWDVVIQVANGTHAGFLAYAPFVGKELIYVRGNAASPTSVIINQSVVLEGGATLVLEGLTLSPASGDGIVVRSGLAYLTTVRFSGSSGFGIFIAYDGEVEFWGGCTVTGTYNTFIGIIGGTLQLGTQTYTMSGTPNVGTFLYVSRNGTAICDQATMSGGATGQRYSVDSEGLIFTSGKGVNFLPGSTAGSSNGGSYV